MFRLTKIFIDYPKCVALACLAIVVVMGFFAVKVEKDNSMGNMIPDDNEAMTYYHDVFEDRFVIRSRVVVGVFNDESIFNARSLEKIARITKHLENDPRLEQVVSLSSAEDFTVVDGFMEVKPVMETLPETPEQCAALKEKLDGNSFLKTGLISRDGRASLILAVPTFDISDSIMSIELYQDVEKYLEEVRGPEHVVFAGYPMAIGMINQYMSKDIRTLMPLVVGFLIVILFFAFRSMRGVFIPIAVVVFSGICTFGIMYLTGIKISMLGTSIPIVIVAIGVADGIHVLAEYYFQLQRGKKRREAVILTMEEMNTPIIMTSVTTFVGFLALAVSEIIPIREYGVFVGIGVMIAMVFSLAFIPAMLILLPVPKNIRAKAKNGQLKLSDTFSHFLGQCSLRRPRTVFAIFILLIIATAYLTTQVYVSNDTIKQFQSSSKIRQADELLNENFGGTSLMIAVLDSGKPEGAKDPKFLAMVEGLENDVLKMEEVGFTESLTDYIKRMNLVMQGQDRLPQVVENITDDEGNVSETPGRNIIAQYLLLYEMGGGEELGRITDDVHQMVNVVVSIRSNNSVVQAQVLARMQDYVANNFDDSIGVEFTGNAYVMLEIVKLLVDGQVRSLILSLTVVLITLLIIFRSFRVGLLGVTPLVMTVLLNFSIMVLFDIPLNAGTALIASISIGIGVDYAIHFLHRYRLERKRETDPKKIIDITMATSGRAIILNALAVGLGFSVLAFSSFVPLIYLGILMPLMMLASGIGSLVIIPTIMNLRK
jgi:uncharacterized protein